ncbi:hypothetical protein P4056_12660 [Pseudomonas aeruginosa]|nr:hypothetical protein [Pseudomonas aeruginosa]
MVETARQNVGFAKLDAAASLWTRLTFRASVPHAEYRSPVMWNMKMRYRGLASKIPRTISEFLQQGE